MNNHEWRQRKILLPALRETRMRLRYMADEIDAMGIMLKFGGLTISQAVEWMDNLGITQFVGELTVRSLAEGDGTAQATGALTDGMVIVATAHDPSTA